MKQDEYNKIVKDINDLTKKEQELVLANMPKFERGVTEASIEREAAIWKEVRAVLDKHGLSPSVSLTIMSDTQPSKDPHRPNLVCAGVKVSLDYIVNPVDLSGKDGKMPDDVIDSIVEWRKEKAELNRKLEGGV